MTKTNKILIAVLVLQVVLIMGMRFGGESKLDYTATRVLPTLEADDVTSLQIDGPPKTGDGPPQNSVTLTKKNGAWGVASADDFPVEATKVKELLEKLESLTSRTRVLDSGTYHEKLEVAPDKFQRKVTLDAKGTKTVLYVGSSASFKNVHVRVDGQDAVYLVNDFATTDVGDRAWNWVDRDYVKLDKANVWRVDVKNAKGTLTLEKNPVDNLWAALGVTEPLDKTKVDDLVRKATQIDMEAPVSKAAKPEFGLDSPLATVTLVTGTSTIAGTPPPKTDFVTVKVGKKIEAESAYYVKASTSEYVVKVQAFGVEPLVNHTKDDLLKKEE